MSPSLMSWAIFFFIKSIGHDRRRAYFQLNRIISGSSSSRRGIVSVIWVCVAFAFANFLLGPCPVLHGKGIVQPIGPLGSDRYRLILPRVRLARRIQPTVLVTPNSFTRNSCDPVSVNALVVVVPVQVQVTQARITSNRFMDVVSLDDMSLDWKAFVDEQCPLPDCQPIVTNVSLGVARGEELADDGLLGRFCQQFLGWIFGRHQCQCDEQENCS
mmetsp:Transcript_15909/g.45747  ORF Transcript_15909/g.45747 Transcript_15909/m.45747 type:complete len:215 (-) Transcript_15909:238-882(-)